MLQISLISNENWGKEESISDILGLEIDSRDESFDQKIGIEYPCYCPRTLRSCSDHPTVIPEKRTILFMENARW